MPEEEKTEVEETEAEEKTEIEAEEKVVEEKTVEEAKVVDGDSGGSGSGASEEAVKMLKAALPEALPLGTVLKMNYIMYFPNMPDTPPEYDQQCVIGLPDGNVGMYIPAGGAGSSPDAKVEVVSYDAFIEIIATLGTDESLESVCCGCSMPSKDSIMFVANLTAVDESYK